MHPDTPSSGGGITFTSWNVRGLGHVLKRAKVFSHLKSLSTDIVYLQETHIRPTKEKLLRCSWANQIFQSTFSSKARGVAILIRKTVPFRHVSTVSDPNGRFILVTGYIHSFHVTLLNVYGPNFDDPAFFRKIFSSLPDLSDTHLIVGGDFNCVLDSRLDRSAQSNYSSTSSMVLNDLMSSMNLVDIWRLGHPTDRDYSFFSQMHKSFSRIDYFLIDSKLISNVIASKYHNILISDHSPTSLVLDLNYKKQQFTWSLHPSLFSDASFCQYISTKISEFLESNDNSEVTDSTLWETFKVVIRGHIISFESSLKKERRKRLSEIEIELSQLELVYRTSSSPSTLQNILKLKYEYNTILSNQICDQLFKIRQKHFELGDKPHKLLAQQLRGLQASRAIHKIKSKTGDLVIDPKKINDRFREYYEELYRSKAKGNVSDWMEHLRLPKLSAAACEALNSDITTQEILDALKSFPNGKAAGPDGFGIELYKKFSMKVAPLLLRMFNHSFGVQKFPPTLYEANISLLLKEGRDEAEPSSFRPIALLNSDIKIFTKLLANRLNKYISSIIHTDQTGFVPNRYSFFNVRRLMNIMYHKYSKSSKVAALCLDAEKAFDQVEWAYMVKALEEFGFGRQFVSWITMLYAHPSSSILTNQERSLPFRLHRGTRQGCPLSPLLFAIAIEPLAISIRNHASIEPIRLGNVDHHISLYADDVVLFISQPEKSVPVLLDLIKTFGEVSGYTINWQKSEFMSLGADLNTEFLHNLPFKITNRLKYLGVVLPKDPKLIFKMNFLEKLEKLRRDIEKWRTLPLSMVGRINAIKMVSLPRFLYLFQNLPIFLARSFFKSLDSIILPFIWGFKAHRISKTHLHKPGKMGGLGLPNFLHYYWAANARALVYWQEGYNMEVSAETPPWVAIEMSDVKNSSLPALLFSTPRPPATVKMDNMIIFNCLKIWQQIRKDCRLPGTSIHAPVYRNHAFSPSLSDGSFNSWRLKGVVTLKDLYVNKKFATFAQLQNKFSLPATHFFRYLQIRNYVRQCVPNFESLPEDKRIYKLLLGPLDSRKLVSGFVNIFSERTVYATHFLKNSWEEELGMQIGDDVWREGLARIRSCSISTRHQLIQFKVMHRLHYSKTKLHRIFPTISSLCDRCKSAEGSLTHIFWTCPKLNNFWCSIFKWFSDMYSCIFEPDPMIALFGVSPSLLNHRVSMQSTIMYGMVVAKKMILKLWKSDTAPHFRIWLSELIGILHMEKVRYGMMDNLNKFSDIWEPFLAHLDKYNTELEQQGSS